MPAKPGFYAVRIVLRGACQEQVLGFSCARFKKFKRTEDAWAFVQNQAPPTALQSRAVELGNGSAQAQSTSSENADVGEETKMSTIRTDPLSVFFAQYSDFEYNPAGSATDEFYRLCNLYCWDRDDREKQDAKQGFQDALTLQFNKSYGTSVDDLTNWQALCAKLGMDPVPETLKTCREAVQRTYVNLVDLVDISGTQSKAQLFPTEFALSEYTKDEGKFFPRDNIHAGDLLKFLLRNIMIPGLSRNEGRSGRGRRRVYRSV